MRRLVLAGLAFAALAAGAPAGAGTWQVWLGNPLSPPNATPEGANLNQFFPGSIQIRAGDRIRFSSRYFHTVSYLGAQTEPAQVVPDPGGATLSGIVDAFGSPFWFNGLPKLLYNPQIFAPVGSTVINDDQLHNSGVLTPGVGRPTATFTFPRVGTYGLVCLIHPGMKGRVVVKPKGARVPKAAAVAARVKREIAQAWAKARPLARMPVPANTVFAGVGGTTTLLAFLPRRLTVRAGATVNFVNQSPSEPHNMAWGEANYLRFIQDTNDLVPFQPGAPNQYFPIYAYGSEPAGLYVHNGRNHGNGFLATPLLDDQPGDPPMGLAKSFAVQFTAPGTYHYICQIHGPDMAGDIVVTG